MAYPIIRLGDRGILVRPLVAALEAAMIETCAAPRRRGDAPRRPPGLLGRGRPGRGRPHRKIGALGLRIERGVSYHGIALNIDVDLRDFDLIDPCGMPGLVSTSIAEELGRSAEPPTTAPGGARRRDLRGGLRRGDRRADRVGLAVGGGPRGAPSPLVEA